MTGGNIRNIAMAAAFLAAGDQKPVGMRHLARAARTELVKQEKTTVESELADWR